jgi:transketolase
MSEVDCYKDSLSIPLDIRSKELRTLVLNGLEGGGRGHLGPALSIIEILRSLYDHVLVHDPSNSKLAVRDRFILSKGHGVLAVYAILATHGYFPPEEIDTFCKFDSRLPGHPESGDLPGIEFSTGSLGHGLPVAIGIAMAARIKNENWKTFVLIGDGEMAEGSIWESALHASKHELGRITVIMDYNKMQASGSINDVLPLEPILQKWESFGFEVAEVNGHDVLAITNKLLTPSMPVGKPRFLLAHTVKGKGLSIAENSSKWHHKAKISVEEVNMLREYLA